MRFLDRRHPFFKPLWRRLLTVAVPVIWSGFELAGGSAGWAILFLAAGAWAAWELFMAPQADAEEDTRDNNGKGEDGA